MSSSALTGKLFTLEGVTVENGYNDEAATSEACSGYELPPSGAGLRVRHRKFEIRNCEFHGHHSQGGSAILSLCAIEDSIIAQCVFAENRAYLTGASITPPALPCLGTPTLGDEAGDGGAIWLYNSSVRIEACVFRCNLSAHVGGAIQMQGGGNPVVTNSTFLGNYARSGGAIRSGFDTYSVIANCSIAGNQAVFQGGGLSVKRADSGNNGSVNVLNCIIWNNEVIGDDEDANGMQVYVNSADEHQVVLRACDIGSDLESDFNEIAHDGSYGPDTPNTFYTDPQFVSASGADERWGTDDDNVRVTHNGETKSPCIDAGVHADFSPGLPVDKANLDGDSSVTELMSRDFDIVNRFQRAEVDVGAFESSFCPADLDDDDTVGSNDLAKLMAAWGTCQSPCFADLVNDNVVDGSDLGILLGEWGSCGSYQMSASEEGATSPGGVAASLGFESVQEMVDWLVSLDEETMFAWLQLVFGI